MAVAAVRAASAERADCCFGKTHIAYLALRAVFGTVPAFVAISTFVFGYIVAAYSARCAFGSLAIFADLGAVVVVGVVGIHTPATTFAMQTVLVNAIGASAALRAGSIGVFGKAYLGAERAWYAVSVTVPAVATVGAFVHFKTSSADKAGNAFVGRHTALAVFGAVAVNRIIGVETCVAIGAVQAVA